jgi:hypothetical protein
MISNPPAVVPKAKPPEPQSANKPTEMRAVIDEGEA